MSLYDDLLHLKEIREAHNVLSPTAKIPYVSVPKHQGFE